MRPTWTSRIMSMVVCLRMRHLPGAIFGLLVLAIAVWAVPRRIDRVISSDGAKVWDSPKAPPRRAFTWEFAQAYAPAQESQAELTTPRLTDDGATLYFTRKTAKGRADIYRCRRGDGSWSTPEPMREWNSPADDVCPAFSPDGRQVVFASNRFKSEGGFDLYISERTGTRWSPPRSLGQRINSTADDIDPAFGPDGRIYFSSNRPAVATPKPAADRPSAAAVAVSSSPNGAAGSRSEQPAKFDLYVTTPESPGDKWSIPEPMASINQPDSDERAPFLAPQGTSLYFASDRREKSAAARPGQRRLAPNLDLYRAVWNGAQFAEAENLGPEINTPANETGPGLSSEGFTLLFSSNRLGTDALFQSRALEVYHATGWDTSNLRALASIWWQGLLFVLAGAVLLVIWRFRRRLIFNRASAVQPFAFSLGIHCILCMGLTFVPLATIVIDRSDEYGGAIETQLFGQSLRPPEKQVAAVFTKLADLPSDQVVLVPEIERQETAPMNLPGATEKPVMTLPRQVARAAPAQIEMADNTPSPVMRRPIELDPRLRQRPIELAAAEEAAAEVIPAAVPVEERQVETQVAMVGRQPAASEAAIPELPSQPAILGRQHARPVEVPLRRNVEVAALPDPQQIPVAVKRPRRLVKNPDDDPLILEAMAGAPNVAEPLPSQPAEMGVSREVAVLEAPGRLDRPVEIARPAVTPSREKKEGEILRTAAVGDRADTKVAPLTMPRDATKRNLPREIAAVDSAAPADLAVVPGNSPVESPVAAAQIALERSVVSAPAITPAEVGDKLEGPVNRTNSRLVLGVRGDTRVEAPPSFGPMVTLLDRLPSRARRVAIVDESIGMEAMFTLRQSEARREFIDLFGGNEASEASVDRGLVWLAAHQEPEGFWSLEKNSANSRSDTAGTGLALLPFLAAGHSPQTGKYQDVVNRGLKWLIVTQKPDGDLMSKDDNPHWRMYAHGIATIALCEAYGISKQPEFKEPTQRALDFIIKSQNQTTGGWRYQPQDPGDTSVVGWMVMALKSGEMAGIPAPQAAYVGAQRWLASVEANKPVGGQFGYTGPAPTASMTAEGLLCLQFMGSPRNHPRMRSGADFVLANLPDPARDTSYYWYYGTQMMYHMQGDYWKAWNGKLRDMLVSTQVKDGPNAGTWDPRDPREVQGGRLYSTSLKLLMLEIYYRHLPLYQQLED